MTIYQYFLFIIFITLLCGDNQTAEDILLKSLHRLDGIDHQFKLDSKQSGKKKKEKHFQVFVHWPSEKNLLRQIRITSILTKQKKPISYWENSYNDERRIKKWMSLPVTGRLKDVSDKKSRKKDFSFAELSVTHEDIRSLSHGLLPREKIDTLSAYVIESLDKSKKGKIKESKKLWIDTDSYMILKAEFYTGSGRLYRNIECSNFYYINEVMFPMNIYVKDLKSKKDIHITLKGIELYPEFDKDIFIPKDQ